MAWKLAASKGGAGGACAPAKSNGRASGSGAGGEAGRTPRAGRPSARADEAPPPESAAAHGAGTPFHGTRVPLRTWFLAIFCVARHKQGISALQFQRDAGLGSYKTGWQEGEVPPRANRHLSGQGGGVDSRGKWLRRWARRMYHATSPHRGPTFVRIRERLSRVPVQPHLPIPSSLERISPQGDLEVFRPKGDLQDLERVARALNPGFSRAESPDPRMPAPVVGD